MTVPAALHARSQEAAPQNAAVGTTQGLSRSAHLLHERPALLPEPHGRGPKGPIKNKKHLFLSPLKINMGLPWWHSG